MTVRACRRGSPRLRPRPASRAAGALRARPGWRGAASAAALALLAALGSALFAPPGTASAASAATAAPSPTLALPSGALEAASGESYPLAVLRGRPALIVVADRSAAGDAAAWGHALGERCPEVLALGPEHEGVLIVSVADLSAVPAFARPMARWLVRAFAAQEPGDRRAAPPLLLDWEGAVRGAIGAAPGAAALRVFDAEGQLVAAAAGPPDAASVERIDAALRRAIGPLDRTGHDLRTAVERPPPAAPDAEAERLAGTAVR